MKIRVSKSTLSESYIFYTNDKKREHVLVNTKPVNFSAERFNFLITNIVRGWPNELTEPSILDGLEYRISIREKGKEENYVFKNKFPEDIFRLEMALDMVLEAGYER